MKKIKDEVSIMKAAVVTKAGNIQNEISKLRKEIEERENAIKDLISENTRLDGISWAYVAMGEKIAEIEREEKEEQDGKKTKG